MADGHQFNNILLVGRGGTNPGQLRIHSGGIVWRRQGGGKVVDVAKNEVKSLSWTRVPRGYQLGVKLKAGLNIKLAGFREQDVSNLTNFMTNTIGLAPEDKQLSVSGRNWGEVDLDGNMLSFLVGSKQAFEVSLADVSQAQLQGRNDVLLEFHVDDTTGANEKDSLIELSFHIPNTNTTFTGDESRPPAQILRDKIMQMADVGVGPSGESVVVFEDVAVLTPRGRYTVELHLSFLRLQGQANDFKIQYSSVVRLFLLPRSNQPHTFVVISLDPPIRKGQTFYPHIVLQFATEELAERELSISEELLNSKFKDRLEPSYKGLSHEVFIQILRGLSGAKVTRPGKFRSCQDGYAVRASLKAEDGVLYPLEKSFFFLPKPPTLILHEEIEYLEFERHGAAGTSSMSSHYFDLIIKLKSEQEHQFRNIQRNEYHNLFSFINTKGLKIINLGATETIGGVAAALQNSDDEAVDPHLERIKNLRDGGAGDEDSDEEDEDFVAENDDAGSPTDESEEEGSDASESAEVKQPAKKEVKKKKAVAPKATETKKKKKDDEEEGGKKKQRRKKKDPNAPKKAMEKGLCSEKPVTVVITDECPGGYCAFGRTHFDLSGAAFGHMATNGKTSALLNSGELPVLYRRTLCEYPGKNITFHVTEGSTAYWFSILIEYEDGDGDVGAMHLKQAESDAWMEMRHVWGANWCLLGSDPLKAPFSVRVTTLTSKRTLSASNVIPEHWYPNATYKARLNFDD